MKLRLFTVLVFSALLFAAPVGTYAQDASAATTTADEKDLFSYLDQSINWYRHVTMAESSDVSSRETLLQRSLEQSALKSLRYSFDFARIQADVMDRADEEATEAAKEEEAAKPSDAPPAEEGKKGEPPAFNPVQAKINIATRISELNKEIAANDAALARAISRNRPGLVATRDKLAAELNLAKTQSGLIDAVMAMSITEKEETVKGQIENLAKAIPELATTKKKTTTAAPTPETPAASQDVTASQVTQLLTTGVVAPAPEEAPEKSAESKGIIGLIGELMARQRQKQDLADLLSETKTMQQINEAKINAQRDRLLEIVRRSKELSEAGTGTVTDTVQQGNELQDLNDDFKQVSDFIVPLAKQRMTLRNAAQTIVNWQGIFTDEMGQIARRLLTRTITLIIFLAVPFLLSELARRALSQYVADARRRRQLNIMRRIIVGIIIGLVVLLNLVSEFGSMATFIGFVTAGLAVALQNVILSIVAYFFFFGRFGIKVGSRVSVGVVTGDVIETGFVRLYLMELTEEKGSFRPTGRIVAFPNSILFQPTAFFKQVPGVSYRWHEMTYVLEAETTRADAETKLREIVDSVYKDNKGMIDMQKAAMEQSTRLRVKEPRPDGKIEKTPDGMNVIIRYPVDVEQAETTDKNVMRIAKEVFERLPGVKLLNDEPPVIKRK